MIEFLQGEYNWLRALHIISVIAWMAGMLYLPRLFVYHSDSEIGSETSETFKIMERKLFRYITTPAMISALIFGILIFISMPELMKEGWMHAKLGAIILLFGLHGVLAKHLRLFAQDKREKSAKYYRILNEIPALLMVVIVVMAVVQPF